MLKYLHHRMWKGICLGILLLALPVTLVFAADYLDPQFGESQGYITLDGLSARTATQSTGQILVLAQDANQSRLYQFLENGSPDTSFGTNGLVTFSADMASDLALTPDGKILVAGKCETSTYGDAINVSLQRFLPDGKPDITFNHGDAICQDIQILDNYLSIEKVLVQQDGKILVLANDIFVGDVFSGNGLIARFDSLGELDTTFGQGGTFYPDAPDLPGPNSVIVENMALQSDGKILVLGTVRSLMAIGQPPNYPLVVRLTDQGQYDRSFNGTGEFYDYQPASLNQGCTVAVQKSGRIIVQVQHETEAGKESFLLGLTGDGVLDPGFGNAGSVMLTDPGCNLLVLPTDGIVTAGYADPNLIVRMFTPDGEAYQPFADHGTASFDFLGTPNGINLQSNGKLLITSNSPTGPIAVARLGLLFEDVGYFHWASAWIERLYKAGVTGGCTSSPLKYCPSNPVSRAQMAVLLVRSEHGAGYVPPPAIGIFEDVGPGDWTAPWIEQLSREGISGGCFANLYCPFKPVTRAQMAIFLLRAEHGSAYIPPAATGVFLDVPKTDSTAPWIEQLAREGITGGCGGGNYCPAKAVTRDQMAVFLVRTFKLP